MIENDIKATIYFIIKTIQLEYSVYCVLILLVNLPSDSVSFVSICIQAPCPSAI